MIKPRARRRALGLCAALAALLALGPARADSLVRTIATVKPSVVGVGSFLKTRSPSVVFSGTGFAVADGMSIITNAHVVPSNLDASKMEELGVVVGAGQDVRFRAARLVALDREHDLAHLRLVDGPPLPALALGDSRAAAEGQALAFTGFPLGMVLGLNHVTHRATLSAITPIVMPSLSSRRLDARAIAQLQRDPVKIFQLDGTAYPGNSGSPVYDAESGAVLGVINMVFVKGLKETAITSPSGISYAVPVQYVQELLRQK
ncbi:S1 family peptidase [Massilia litorea]|uniref:Trypsin-like peptidase domain-containing protein n=1 Tax=Massilia litorea TaxID=2769491 RepID=A0A7L9U7G6_9BURK|nr:serine protease [Massilia litorea]QOL50964.1 trypsin-like peptidase domain-containing protein [Massilia litorea]